MVKLVIDQRSGGAPVGTAGNVAPGIVATGVDLPGFAGTGGAGSIQAD